MTAIRNAVHVLAFAAVLLTGSGCGDAAAPSEPGAPDLELEPFEPPAAYRILWAEIQACSGLQGSFTAIEFYEVVSPLRFNGSQFPCGPNGETCFGAWEPPHRVILAPASLDVARIVKHEMLHELLRVPGHPPVFEACDVDL